jgi:hypothetical protein
MDTISFPSLESEEDTTSNKSISKQVEYEKLSIRSDDGQPDMPLRKGSFDYGSDYGYEDAAPDTNNTNYGYEDAAPDNKYGYGDAEPDNNNGKKSSVACEYDGTRVPERSALKGSSGMMPRRASMGCTSGACFEVHVRGNRFPVQRRRSIEFSKKVQIKEVTPVPNMTDSNQIWLQQEDFAEMKKERRTLVHKVKRGEVAQEEADIRGLEKYLDKSIRKGKYMAWDTVLLEQDHQELSGHYDEERIADLYKHTTNASPDKAAARAQQDEEAVKAYLLTPRTTKLMMRRLSC